MTTPILAGDLQVAITLATLTYMNEDEPYAIQRAAMVEQLKHTDLPTAGMWKLVWGPAWGPDELGPNMWYVASGKNSVGAPSLALVIRGTKMNSLDSIRQDAELDLVPVPFAKPRKRDEARIAQGFAEAYNNLVGLTDSVGETAFRFLGRTLTKGVTLDVVGHSLGGAMAPIVGVACYQTFPQAEVRVLSFGGQSPEYRALPNEHRFKGVQYRLSSSEWFPWEIQASKQHEHLYYMNFTGVSTDVIQRRFNPHWIPPQQPAGTQWSDV